MVDRRISPAEQQTVEELRRGLSEAVLVERATGVLMYRDACSPGAARARLAGEALAAGRPLAEHATAVLAAAERGPIGPPGRPGHGAARSPAAGRPIRERVVTADPEEAAERLGSTYRTRVRLWPSHRGLPDGGVFWLTHTDTGHFRVCDDRFPGELSVVTDAAAQLVVAELVAGRAERRASGPDERLTAGDVFLPGHPATPHAGHIVDAHLRTVVLPLPLLHRIHLGGPDSAVPLRFTSLRPATPELGRQWRATVLAVRALPLRFYGRTLGALNLFGYDAAACVDGSLPAAQAFADLAMVAIVQHSHGDQSAALHITWALAARTAIEQAKGMLAEDGGLTIDQALEALRAHAARTGQGISGLATALVRGETDTRAILAAGSPEVR